ncbi:MAG TPA: hypothetical protein GXZ90_02015 [Clostridiales bacterium]|nr:hypothetical protein [Clostridiales bacterium]
MNNQLNLFRGDFCHIAFNNGSNKMATFYEYASNKYLFKSDNGFFEITEKEIRDGDIIIEIMPDF